MTAINNLKGHIVKDGSILYIEELEPNLYFAVIEKYEPKYEKDNYASSSQLQLETLVTTGEEINSSNGVRSLNDAVEIEEIKEEEQYRTLRKLKTKQGFIVREVSYAENHYENENKQKTKHRYVKYIVEVPKNKLIKFINN